jgi:hypothetical protein
VSDNVIMLAVTLVRDEGGAGEAGPLVADLLESFREALPGKGKHEKGAR